MSVALGRRNWPVVAGICGIALTTAVYLLLLDVRNAAIVSTSFLLIVLLVAASSTLAAAIITSLVAMLCFNFFFLPPVRTFTIADPQNWVALFAFLVVSLVASNLSRPRAGTRRGGAGPTCRARAPLRPESRRAAERGLARGHRRRRAGHRAAIRPRRRGPGAASARTTRGTWCRRAPALSMLPPDAFGGAGGGAPADRVRRRGAHVRGSPLVALDEQRLTLVPLRVGTRPIGLLAAESDHVDAGTLDAIAGLAALAVERTQLLEERRKAALTRQSEALKTTLLASIGHDLRTPLTAIRVGVENLRSRELPPAERDAQTDLILAEVARLDRLFQNLLEMARLDAGAVTAERRRTHPSEIIEAARAHTAQALRDHHVVVDVDGETPVARGPAADRGRAWPRAGERGAACAAGHSDRR